MEVDLSSFFDGTEENGIITGLATSVSNAVLETPTAYNRVYADQISVTFDLSSVGYKTVDGYLTGRRPAGGQLYPRGIYNR